MELGYSPEVLFEVCPFTVVVVAHVFTEGHHLFPYLACLRVPYPSMHRGYYWLCAQKWPLVVLRGPYVMLKI